MAFSPRITAAVANAMLDAGIGSLADVGKLRVYDGTQPATGGGAITTQVKLLEFTLDANAFPAAAAGVLTANGIGAELGLANGTATWFRLVKADGTTVLLDGSAGMASCDLILSNDAITTLDVVAVLSMTITQPLT